MNQTHYIDADEEITSAIDRLKKSKASEIFFVIPKRAIVLQSIVNLKLLKREADRAKKEIIFVTQDELGKSFALKLGIPVRPSLPGLEENKSGESEINEVPAEEEPRKNFEEEKVMKRSRLEEIGSRDFFEIENNVNFPPTPPGSGSLSQKPAVTLAPSYVQEENPAVYRLQGQGNKIPVLKNQTRALTPGKNSLMEDVLYKTKKEEISEKAPDVSYHEKNSSLQNEKKLESFFTPREKKPPVSEGGQDRMVSGRVKKVFMVLGAGCFVAVAGIAAYLFIPSAKITVYPRLETKEIDLELKGSAELKEINPESFSIPIRLIEKEKILVLSYSATGKSGASSQKAKGKVVIFNEYSSSSQQLIATTRFLSAEGKLFRLVKNITVPGTTIISGEVKPGAIEAEVIADEAGTAYNIGPSKFSIPGFEGGPKFDKFYAKSEKAMTGGGDAENSSLAVSQGDISSAREKTESAARSQIEEEIKSESGEDGVLLSEIQDQIIEESAALAKAGDIKDNFEYRVKIKSKALVFTENSAKEIAQFLLKQKFSETAKIPLADIQIEYRQAKADFGAKTIEFKAHGKAAISPEIDLERLKNDLLGKDESEVKEILGKYIQIEGLEIDIKPGFMPDRIPQYSRRVSVDIDKK